MSIILFASIFSFICFSVISFISLDGRVLKNDEHYKKIMIVLIWMLGFCALFIAVTYAGMLENERVMAFGQPRTEIAAGTYKVGFVYKAGDRVSVGIEKEKSELVLGAYGQIDKLPTENLLFYQFPESAFAGEVKKDANRLVVTGGLGFKKLELFKNQKLE